MPVSKNFADSHIFSQVGQVPDLPSAFK
jgi:hypothetical protein